MTETNAVEMPKGYAGMKVSCHDVKIFDSHVEVLLPNGMTKAVSIPDFITILSKVVTEESNIKTLLLPAGCYVLGQTISEIKLSCYYPGKIREVICHARATGDALKMKIPFPNVIISHKLVKKTDHWLHVESKYFATSKSVSELDNKFYWEKNHTDYVWTLPLGNIYPEAKLCHGGNTIPRGPYKDNFRGLDWHFAVLYKSAFNNDLMIQSLVQGQSYCESWYKILEKYTSFPYELLTGGKKVTPRTHMSVQQEVMADSIDWITGLATPAHTQATR